MHNISGLRVALIAATLEQGGAEKQFLYLARVLVQAGVDVKVYSLGKGEFYEKAFRELGLTPIWVGRFQHPLMRLVNLIGHLHTFRPHVVQSSHLFANLYAGLAAKATGAISVGTMRSNLDYSRQTNGRWTPWLIRAPRVLLTNSQTTHDELISAGLIKANRLWIVRNAVDVTELDSSAAGGDSKEITAAFVGRLVEVKRVENFLRALALARRSAPELKGVVIGDGPEREKAEILARTLNLGKSAIAFLGRRDDVRSLLARSNMLVMTSRSEGCPNVILEAMAGRLPVVTTPAGDAKLVVDNGVTGYVVSFDDIEQMADRMRLLACSEALRLKMGDAGRRRVQELHSLESLSKTLFSVYNNILSSRPVGLNLPARQPDSLADERLAIPGPTPGQFAPRD